MTLTPSTVRLDLKCGKGSISPGEKCSKGPATKRAPRAGTKERFLKRAGTIGFVGSLGYTAGALLAGKSGHALAGVSALNASAAAFNAGEAIGYERKGQKAKANLARVNAGVAAGYATLGAGLLAYGAKANKFNREADDFRSRYTQERRGYYGGSGGAGYRGAQGGARRPPRRGYQGDPFKDLGVSPSASAADLKQAWKRQMMQHHPDRGGNPETAKKINSAYQAILKSRGIEDSIYADGFDIDWAAIAI